MKPKDPPEDLDKYLPDRAAAEAVLNGPIPYNRNIDPKLRERQRELNRLSSEPEPLRPAPPSVTAYAEAEIREANPEHKTLPRIEPRVELAVPPAPSEMPTQPSLKRIEGEPEVPGVVSGVPRRGLLGISWRGAALAVLTVFLPVLLVIVLMGREVRKAEHEREASVSAARPTAPSPAPSAPLPVAPTAAPKEVASPAPEPSEAPSAEPAVPAPKESAAMPVPKRKPGNKPVKTSPTGTSTAPERTVPTAHPVAPSPEPSAIPPFLE